MKHLVSILIPAYNAEEWIADTLRSAVAQTWEQKEIIVVDDGSTDATPTVARSFQRDGVKLISQKNQGAARARNKALSFANGDYIQWLDADDLLAPDKIARQMILVQQGASKSTLLSSAWGRFMYRPRRAEFIPTALWCDLSPVEWLLRKLGRNLFMQPGTWLVSRELTEAAGPWDHTLLSDDDGEYFCRVLLASDGVRFVPGARMYYRAASNQLSYIGTSDLKLEALMRSLQLHIRYLLSLEDSTRTREACVRYLQTWLPFFFPERPDLVQQAERMASDLGRRLESPHLPWKYSWIEATLGCNVAKRAQGTGPRFRWWLEKSIDKTFFTIENLIQRNQLNMQVGVEDEGFM